MTEAGTSSETLPEGYRMTELGPLPKEWRVVRFEKSVVRKRVRVGKLKQKEYKSYGKYPVIDQGKNHIAGYTDREELVYQGELPIIIFGDHTRVWKFVDFPFVCGADGTKILLPNTEIFDPLFLFFAFQRLDIPSRGYNRHYALLREKTIPLPPLSEQRAIAHVLRTVQESKEATERVIGAVRELKKSLMRHLFTYGPVPMDQVNQVEMQETEIGSIPARWQVVRFEKSVVRKRVRVGKLKQKEYKSYGKYPVIDQGKNHIAGYTDREELVYQGELPIIIFGDHTRVWKFVDFPFVCGADGTKILLPNTEIFDPLFLFFAFQRLDIPSRGYNRHYALLREKTIPLPPLPEQQEIARILQMVDRKIEAEEAKRKALEELFRSLLHELLTARRRLPAQFVEQFEEKAEVES